MRDKHSHHEEHEGHEEEPQNRRAGFTPAASAHRALPVQFLCVLAGYASQWVYSGELGYPVVYGPTISGRRLKNKIEDGFRSMRRLYLLFLSGLFLMLTFWFLAVFRLGSNPLLLLLAALAIFAVFLMAKEQLLLTVLLVLFLSAPAILFLTFTTSGVCYERLIGGSWTEIPCGFQATFRRYGKEVSFLAMLLAACLAGFVVRNRQAQRNTR